MNGISDQNEPRHQPDLREDAAEDRPEELREHPDALVGCQDSRAADGPGTAPRSVAIEAPMISPPANP